VQVLSIGTIKHGNLSFISSFPVGIFAILSVESNA
jgi:hypothetical protein